MKITVLSKADERGGGASRIASELVDHLLAAGRMAEHWVGRCYGEVGHPVRKLYGERRAIDILIRLGHLALRKAGAPELLAVERLNPALAGLLSADVIHAHDITNTVAVQTLRWLARHRPLVWTLHDCSPFTGGCLYPIGCERYRACCGQCPEWGQWPLVGAFDFTASLLRQKRRFTLSASFVPIAPSQWMADMAAESGFFPRPRVISNGIDLQTFRPEPKAAARRRLGWRTDRPVLAVCSGDLDDPRKGIRQALGVARAARVHDPLVLVIGRRTDAIIADFPDLDLFFTGFVTDRAALASYYCTADLLLFCSYADNQPLTVMESMACGTPVVGFATGGIPELVDHLENGLLVPTGDTAALEREMTTLLEAKTKLREWSAAAAEKAQRLFGWERCLAVHLDLYESLIESGDRPG